MTVNCSVKLYDTIFAHLFIAAVPPRPTYTTSNLPHPICRVQPAMLSLSQCPHRTRLAMPAMLTCLIQPCVEQAEPQQSKMNKSLLSQYILTI